MYCSSCGEELASDANFCEHCGAQVDQSESTDPAPEQGSQPATGGGETGTGSTGSASTAEPRTESTRTAETAEPRERDYERERDHDRERGHEGEVAGGLEPNVAGALSYLLGFVTGLIFFLMEEDDEFVRFHAAQSMVVFGGLFVLGIVIQMFTGFVGATGVFFGLFALVFSLVWLAVSLGALVLWIFLMVKAYQGETPRIPVAANIADDLV